MLSGTWVAFTHGANDAQKTMGVIALALFANGSIDEFYIPTWVKVAAGLAIARGNVRRRLADHADARPARLQHGARGRVRRAGLGRHGALRRHAAGFPVSTTQCISGAVIGAGATKRFSAVRWGVAGNIVVAWVLTIPAAALVAGRLFWPIEALF